MTETIALRRIAPQPWKNGAGLTRELAVAPAPDGFDWRLSIAEVARDAPFSAFPGIDRCIVLLDGAGMALRLPQCVHPLVQPFTAFEFSGDDAVDARLVDGPTTDFNVMVRRGRWRAEVVAGPRDTAAADAGLLLCWRGSLHVQAAGTASTLPAQHARLWRNGLPPLSCMEDAPGTLALLVRLLAL